MLEVDKYTIYDGCLFSCRVDPDKVNKAKCISKIAVSICVYTFNYYYATCFSLTLYNIGFIAGILR